MELRLFIVDCYTEYVSSSTDFDNGYYKPCCGSTKVYHIFLIKRPGVYLLTMFLDPALIQERC